LGTSRGRGRGRGSGATGRGRAANAAPKSVAELDSEIDAFMAVDSASGTPAAKSADNGDVEMA
jgi:C-terminal duplication domain of Friend of PRMT1